MSPRIKLPAKPTASITAMAECLGLDFRLVEFWRVELVNEETGKRAAIGDYDDKQEALAVFCWMNDGNDIDEEGELLEAGPATRAEVTSYHRMVIELGQSGKEVTL